MYIIHLVMLIERNSLTFSLLQSISISHRFWHFLSTVFSVHTVDTCYSLLVV